VPNTWRSPYFVPTKLIPSTFPTLYLQTISSQPSRVVIDYSVIPTVISNSKISPVPTNQISFQPTPPELPSIPPTSFPPISVLPPNAVVIPREDAPIDHCVFIVSTHHVVLSISSVPSSISIASI
jgi:hypothetical protein